MQFEECGMREFCCYEGRIEVLKHKAKYIILAGWHRPRRMAKLINQAGVAFSRIPVTSREVRVNDLKTAFTQHLKKYILNLGAVESRNLNHGAY
jgi:hypothetical protein